MDEMKDKYLDDDLLDIFQSAMKLQKSHSKLLKTSMTQHKGLEKMSELLKLAGETHEKQNEMQKHTDKLIVQQKTVIDNLLSVKQENKQLKEQIQAMEENCVALQKEFEVEKGDLNEQIKVISEVYEEKINKINDANLEKEFKMKNDWTEIQKNWEITRKQFDAKLEDEKRNMEALTVEKNDVLKATIKKYEEQLKNLRESLENAKHEQEVLEKRNLENIKIHEQKIEELEKHYIKMMEGVSHEIKPINESRPNVATTSTPNSNLNLGLSKFNQSSFKVLSINDINKTQNSTQIGSAISKINDNTKTFRVEENKMSASTATKSRLENLSNWQPSTAKVPPNFQYCQPNQTKNTPEYRQPPIKPILTSLSQFSHEGGSLNYNKSVQDVKKVTPLQSFPADNMAATHPLYAGKQVSFANPVKDSEQTGRSVQFPTKKRKL